MYLVTGASGFIGKHLLDLLVRRGKPIYCLVRPSSEQGFRDLIDERWPSERSQIAVLQGDVGLPNCGLSSITIDELGDTVKHVFHLAALYDMRAGREASQAANVEGTRNACRLAEALGATLHHISSINYFGSLKLILGFLPGMRKRKQGHIVNISSIGVQTNAPRFSAYVASKAALDAFGRSIASETGRSASPPGSASLERSAMRSCPRSSIASSTRDTASFPTHRRKAGKMTMSIRDPKPSRLHTFCTGFIGERAGRECPAGSALPVL